MSDSKPLRFFYILEEHRTTDDNPADRDYIPVLFTEGQREVGVMRGQGEYADPWRCGKTRKDALEWCYRRNQQDFGLTPDQTLDLFRAWGER